MTRIKGSVLQSRIQFVQDHAPNGGLERVLAHLSPEEEKAIRHPLATMWYAFDLMRRLDEAITTELGGGRPEFFEVLGIASAEKNLGAGGAHRAFLVPGDPHAFLERAPMIYEFYYDVGRRTYQKIGPTEGVLTTYDAEVFSAPDCATVVGWHSRAIEYCGGRDPKVIEEECRARGGTVCRYRISWS